MDSHFFADLKDKVRALNRTLVLPEAEDERILAAAKVLQGEGLAKVVLVGRAEAQKAAEFDRVDPNTSDRLEEYVDLYRQARPRGSAKVAEKLLKKPLYFAGMMVRAGDADGLVAGVAHPSARVLEACLLTIGLADGIATPSSYFLMFLKPAVAEPALPEVLLFADCALNVTPSVTELADIGVASALTYQRLLNREARVAYLSFSTKGSANHDAARRMAEAAALAAKRLPGFAVDGELQLDAAISSAVARRKVVGTSPVAGRANVLIFPDLAAGNIGYKLTQYLAGAQAVGPLLQGLSAPASDLSRGASVQDIVATALLTLAGT